MISIRFRSKVYLLFSVIFAVTISFAFASTCLAVMQPPTGSSTVEINVTDQNGTVKHDVTINDGTAELDLPIKDQEGNAAGTYRIVSSSTLDTIDPHGAFETCYIYKAVTSYIDIVGITVMTYTVSDRQCVNSAPISDKAFISFDNPQYSAYGLVLISLASHSESTEWSDKPYVIETDGTYDFHIGISIGSFVAGSDCAGSVAMFTYSNNNTPEDINADFCNAGGVVSSD